MNKKNEYIGQTKKLLFSELVYLMCEDEDNADIYEKEILKRLIFCGFDDEMSKSIIKYEIDIIEKTNFKVDIPLYKQKYWLSDNFKPKLNLDPESYGVFQKPIGPKENTFVTSFLLFLDDEIGYIITHLDNIKNKDVLKEVKKFMPDEKHPWLQHEFFNRINYYNHLLGRKQKTKELEIKEERFFYNELQILFINKYKIYDTWLPYSNDYFEIYD